MKRKESNMENLYLSICPVKLFLQKLSRAKQVSSIAAILCTTREINYRKLRGIPYLQLEFDDVLEGEMAFDINHARRIALFLDAIEKDKPHINRVYICCEAGVSRSTAVVAAILDANGQNSEEIIFQNPLYHPNMLVYEVLARELGVKVTPRRLKKLKRASERAFKKAVGEAR